MEREQAARASEVVGEAERRVRRHSINNGAIPLVWGALVLVALPLFDFLPGAVAGTVLTVMAALASLWTVRYARGQSVHASRSAAREYNALFIGWGIYYGVVLIGGMLLLRDRVAYPATLLAPVAVAPLLLGGWLMARRGRGGA